MLFNNILKSILLTALILTIGVIPKYSIVSGSEIEANSGYMSSAGAVLGTYVPQHSEYDPKTVSKLASRFLSLLSQSQSRLAQYDIDDPERETWSNRPVRGEVGGVPIGGLNDDQLTAFLDLLANLLSSYGYKKVRDIMLGDDLRSVINGVKNNGVGVSYFRIAVFGNPDPKNLWGLQLDGHHIALNFTLSGENFSMSPSFIGTYPQTYTVLEEELSPMGNEVEYAFELVQSLTDHQKQDAITAQERGKIQTGPGKDDLVPNSTGLNCKTFTEHQRKAFKRLVSQWTKILPEPYAQEELNNFLGNLEQTTFSWSGSIKNGSDISFSIQSPKSIIEFANDHRGSAETSHPREHVHSMYRNFDTDYGKGFL